MSMTFEAFLRDAAAKGGEVRLVPRLKTLDLIEDKPTVVEFYAHVNGQDSATVDFAVYGDVLVALHDDPAIHAAKPPAPAEPDRAPTAADGVA